MQKLLSVLAIAAGLALVYAGYVRQNSLAGRTDASLSRLGERLDGAQHAPTHVKYYAAGALLLAAGSMGLGLVKR